MREDALKNSERNAENQGSQILTGTKHKRSNNKILKKLLIGGRESIH